MLPLLRRLPASGHAAWLVLVLLAGCVSPQDRAARQPGVLRALPPDDQRLVLAGRIREGFGEEAVAVAWGPPTRVETVQAAGQPLVCWLYTHTEYEVAGGFFGISRGFVYHGQYVDLFPNNPGSNDFYVAPPYIRGLPRPETEVPYKRAVFANGRVVDYDSLHYRSVQIRH